MLQRISNHRDVVKSSCWRCMDTVRTIRVVVAKPGLDGHDRGAKVVARALRDAGFEVIYTGLHQTPDRIVKTCIEEDVCVLCLSILSGAHKTLVPEIIRRLRENNAGHIAVLAGGIIPDGDAQSLLEAGCKAVMGPGTTLENIVEQVKRFGEESIEIESGAKSESAMSNSRIEIRLPEFGKEGGKALFLNWLRNVGDFVSEGDELYEVESDKATVVFEAEHSGVLVSIVVGFGEIKEGDLLGYLDA